MLNGYVYISGNSVTDEETLARRAELFASRGGHYYAHWDELYERWVAKVEGTIRELAEIAVPELPEFEDEAVVTEGRGIGSSHLLLVAYDRLLEGLDRMLQYHFEFNGLGYGAYLVFYELCRQSFPDISDQTIAKMVSGIDLLVLRPDEELKRLARLAVELGVAEAVEGADDEEALRAALAGSEAGARWLADFDETKNPWFYFSNGNGLYHHHRSWIDDTSVPIAAIGSYVRRLEAGEDITRPFAAVPPSASGSPTSTARCSPTTCAGLRREPGALREPSSRSSRTTTSTSSTATSRLFWNKVREFGAPTRPSPCRATPPTGSATSPATTTCTSWSASTNATRRRHHLQLAALRRTRRRHPRMPPQAHAHRRRTTRVGQRRRFDPHGDRHPVRPGRWTHLLGELHAPGPHRHVRPGHRHPPRPHLGQQRRMGTHAAPHRQGRPRLRRRLHLVPTWQRHPRRTCPAVTSSTPRR